jgi:ankyrin repeat protein
MLYGSIIALQAAVMLENVDVAQTLIDGGADVDAPMGETFAEAHQAVVDNKERLWRPRTPIQQASPADDIKPVQKLPWEGADVKPCHWEAHIPEQEGGLFELVDLSTALQAAANNKNAVLVRILSTADANIDARGGGDTMLQIAAARDDAKTVQVLLRHDADINAPANAYCGRTALQEQQPQAIASWCKNCWVLVQMSMRLPLTLKAAPRSRRP